MEDEVEQHFRYVVSICICDEVLNRRDSTIFKTEMVT